METIVEELMKTINKETNTDNILKAFKDSGIKDISKISEFVEKFVEVKKEESNKLLSFIEADEFGLNECISIISKFKNIPIFRQIGELFSEEELVPVVDYKYEIEKLEKEIAELEKKITMEGLHYTMLLIMVIWTLLNIFLKNVIVILKQRIMMEKLHYILLPKMVI